ncbi:hypothetical protein ACRALDRAFT_205922 [Sodiomyces alcalophilus JCM 7366]|uniref:uncharacterized protein n=1 Tax=Sodiomyces alcalophilus JCM 7366 TaxID=591952 RepID=UPI0039B657E7
MDAVCDMGFASLSLAMLGILARAERRTVVAGEHSHTTFERRWARQNSAYKINKGQSLQLALHAPNRKFAAILTLSALILRNSEAASEKRNNHHSRDLIASRYILLSRWFSFSVSFSVSPFSYQPRRIHGLFGLCSIGLITPSLPCNYFYYRAVVHLSKD